MTSLRARQKEDRRKRIVASAKTLFRKSGYERTTIENIAEAAGVSSVTVHNYYGTKSGVLLALVIENDALLLRRLEESLHNDEADLVALTVRFARIVMDHATTHLEKAIWRQVLATVTAEAETPLARAYAKLDRQLAYVLVARIEAMQASGHLPARVDPVHLGMALFHLQNARFVQFVSSESLRPEEVETRLRNDLTALFAVCSG